MKKGVLVLFILLAVSCQKKFAANEYGKLNGYWEIEKVVFPDGSEKKYVVNETVDYFEINDNHGFRKKMMPQLNGKYMGNGLAEKITVTFKDDKAFFDYTTDYAKWQEQVVAISRDNLVLKNKQGIEYHYKKPIPFTLK